MKKLLLIFAFLFFSLVQLYAQRLDQNANRNQHNYKVHQAIQQQTDQLFNRLIDIRKDLHQLPELAGHEIKTQAYIKKHLLDLGFKVQTGIYGHSILGVLEGGKKGKRMIWRSDMDGLAMNAMEGVHHGCGHDVHMAIALGIAEVLAKNKASLAGTVYFLFQPEEETFKGAKGMIDNGLLDQIQPDEIYGLHVTMLPVGQVMVKAKEVFAYQKRIQLQLKNELTLEQVKGLTQKIHQSLTRTINKSKPWDLNLASDQTLGLTNPHTIFKDYLIMDENFKTYIKDNQFFMEADLYETDSLRLKDILPTIKRVIESNNYKNQLLSLSFIQENPTVYNDPALTGAAIKTIEKIYGKSVMVPDYGQIPFFNDDFAYFQAKLPGVYFFLGGSNQAKGIIAMNHAANFNVDEECIRTGVKCFSSLIFERLSN